MISRVWSSCLRSRKEEERVHEEDKLNVDERVLTTRRYRNQPEEANTGKEAQNIVNNHHITWHDAQTSMMHVRFKYAWHAKCTNKTTS